MVQLSKIMFLGDNFRFQKLQGIQEVRITPKEKVKLYFLKPLKRHARTNKILGYDKNGKPPKPQYEKREVIEHVIDSYLNLNLQLPFGYCRPDDQYSGLYWLFVNLDKNFKMFKGMPWWRIANIKNWLPDNIELLDPLLINKFEDQRGDWWCRQKLQISKNKFSSIIVHKNVYKDKFLLRRKALFLHYIKNSYGYLINLSNLRPSVIIKREYFEKGVEFLSINWLHQCLTDIFIHINNNIKLKVFLVKLKLRTAYYIAVIKFVCRLLKTTRKRWRRPYQKFFRKNIRILLTSLVAKKLKGLKKISKSIKFYKIKPTLVVKKKLKQKKYLLRKIKLRRAFNLKIFGYRRLKKFEIQSKETLVNFIIGKIIYYLFIKRKQSSIKKTNLFIALLKYILKLKNYPQNNDIGLINVKKQVAYNFEYRQYYFSHKLCREKIRLKLITRTAKKLKKKIRKVRRLRLRSKKSWRRKRRIRRKKVSSVIRKLWRKKKKQVKYFVEKEELIENLENRKLLINKKRLIYSDSQNYKPVYSKYLLMQWGVSGRYVHRDGFLPWSIIEKSYGPVRSLFLERKKLWIKLAKNYKKKQKRKKRKRFKQRFFIKTLKKNIVKNKLKVRKIKIKNKNQYKYIYKCIFKNIKVISGGYLYRKYLQWKYIFEKKIPLLQCKTVGSTIKNEKIKKYFISWKNKLYFHKLKKHKYYGMKVRFVNIIKRLRIKFKSGYLRRYSFK